MPIERIHKLHARAVAAEELLEEALDGVEADAALRRGAKATLPGRIRVHLTRAERDDRENPPTTPPGVRF